MNINVTNILICISGYVYRAIKQRCHGIAFPKVNKNKKDIRNRVLKDANNEGVVWNGVEKTDKRRAYHIYRRNEAKKNKKKPRK